MCFLNQWVKKRKRSVRVSMEAEAGSQRWRGLAPGRSRPAARSPQVRPSERGPGGRGKAARLQAPDPLHWPGRQAARLPVDRGVGGVGRAGSWGSPALRPPSACRKAQNGHLTTRINKEVRQLQGHRTSGVRPGTPFPCSSYRTLLGFPLRHRLPLRQQAPTAAAPPATIPSRWVSATGHPLRMPTTQPRKGAGIAFLPLGRGAE